MAKKPKKPEPDAEGEAGEAKPAKKGLLKNKFVLIGVGILLLAGGGGAGAWKMGFLGKQKDPHAEGAMHKEAEAEKKPASFVDLPEMLVNLDSKERVQYLKVKIALEVSEAKLVEEIQPMMPRVLDTFQTYMRDLRPNDLEGSAGLFRLKEELTRRVNVAVYPAKVDAILFKEIVIQ